MASYNKVILMGNLTRDPELRYTSSGKAVANMGLAVNETWKDNSTGTRQERVSFIDCTAWGRTAEVICEYHQKGDPILIDGRLQQDTWEDKETGQKRSKLKVVVESFTFVRSGGKSTSEQSASAPF